jgi:hypothetical protein
MIETNTSGLATAVVIVGYTDRNGATVPAAWALGAPWVFAAPSGGTTNTSAVTMVAATSGVRNYLSNVQIRTDGIVVACDILVRDGVGGTILARYRLPSGPQSFVYTFNIPIRTSVNTAMVYELTGSPGAGVYINAQGFQM